MISTRNTISVCLATRDESGRINWRAAGRAVGRKGTASAAVSLLGALLLLVASTVHTDELQPAWRTWFKQVVPGLAQVPPPPAAPKNWVPQQTPDRLPVRLPPDYGDRGSHGCWSRDVPVLRGPGYRDVCIHRDTDPVSFWGFALKPFRANPRESDQIKFEEWQGETFEYDGRRIVVERALTSGGIAGLQRVRSLRAYVELGGNELAILQGRTGDDDGYQELLTIATTIGLPHLLSEDEAIAIAEEYVRKNGFIEPRDADPAWAKQLHDWHPENSVKDLVAGRARSLLPRACGVERKIRGGFQWSWHVVFCPNPRKSAKASEKVVQIDVVGHDPFIPENVPDNTSMKSPGIKRLPGMAEFERLSEARRRSRQ
jgi:hypothetical protein